MPPPPTNQREIALDVVENIKQISKWTINGFTKEQENIELYLKLTRKDVNQLTHFPLPEAFEPIFAKFCQSYDKLEKEFHKGIADHRIWANALVSCARELSSKTHLV